MPIRVTRALLLAFVAAPAISAGQTRGVARPLRRAVDRRLEQSITEADLRRLLFAFADDSMQGREAGKTGNIKATDFIAAKLHAIGLRPAGDHGTYFQTVPLVSRSIDPLRTMVTSGTSRLAYGKDVIGIAKAPFALDNVSLVYGGPLGDTLHSLTAAQVAGKFVVYGPPVSDDALDAPPSPVLANAKGSAIAILQTFPPRALAGLQAPIAALSGPQPPAGWNVTTMMVTPDGAELLMGAPLATLRTGDGGADGRTLTAHIAYTDVPSEFAARNVVAILPGSDPVLSQQFVAIGAHSDHLGLSRAKIDHDSLRIFNRVVRPGGAEQAGKGAKAEEQAEINARLAAWRRAHPGPARMDSVYNGADDDGSGSVALLAIARYLSSLPVKPRRSILFVWHTAEEKGKLGSNWFVTHLPVRLDAITAQINLDMVGRGGADDAATVTTGGSFVYGGPDFVELVGSRRRSTELGALVERVDSARGHGLKIDYTADAPSHPSQDYCRSDHIEYARYGIPVSFFKTGRHSDYHQVTDEAQYIDYEHMARVTRLIADVALTLGNLDHRLKLDKPAPEPAAACVQ